MLADRKELNIDAAAQVAHAISTHRVDRESDFFTAVDDWTEDDEADAGMLGTVEFNSSCQYRYAVVNQDQLSRNLGGDDLLARKGLLAFLRAAIMAIPSGRQNTFAAHNLPAFIGIAIHNSQPISLANAFEQPVRADSKQSLTAASVARLETHANQLSQAFGLDLGLKAPISRVHGKEKASLPWRHCWLKWKQNWRQWHERDAADSPGWPLAGVGP